MDKYTKGPWVWVVDADELSDTLPILRGADESLVCDFGDSTTYYPSCGSWPNAANMALIAAAPDLLEACETFVAVLGSKIRDGKDRPEYAEAFYQAEKKMYAAIKKARGEV